MIETVIVTLLALGLALYLQSRFADRHDRSGRRTRQDRALPKR
ncbi:hypothetical protein [Chachezhania sediminis]|nr:hypothetical protein [Chachezhania sediminis]